MKTSSFTVPAAAGAHPRRRKAVLSAVAVGCIGFSVMTLRHDANPPAPPTTTAETAARSTQAGPVPTDLALPASTGSVNGVPTGYPQSLAGAVAAAYGYSRVATGLDVEAT